MKMKKKVKKENLHHRLNVEKKKKKMDALAKKQKSEKKELLKKIECQLTTKKSGNGQENEKRCQRDHQWHASG